MKENPIFFTDEMVRAILDGRKTQTRRVMRSQVVPPGIVQMARPGYCEIINEHGVHIPGFYCPYGQPGDQLWVREKWRIGAWREDSGCFAIDYCDGPLREWRNDPSDHDGQGFNKLWIQCSDELHAKGIEPDDDGHYRWEIGQSPLRWRSSIHMPRWVSRITLEITGVRVERLRDISYEDPQAEGVQIETADPWFYHIPTERNVYDFADDEPQGSFRKLWESINGPDSWNENPWVWVVEFKRVQP